MASDGSHLSAGEAFLRAEEAKERKAERLRSRRFLPSEEEMMRELESERGERSHEPHSEQVGVRLQQAQWKRLLLVAKWNGVRPTTMARILINRGARAIIDEERRHRRDLGDLD
jgi:hypothetical protein